MRLISSVILLIITTGSILFAQKVDTIQVDPGIEGGFQRIREFDDNGLVRKIWFTFWKEDGTIKKSYESYNEEDERVISVDSTFNGKNQLIEVRTRIGDSLEGETTQFDSTGKVIRKVVSVNLNNQYYVFRKDFSVAKNGWEYSAIKNHYPLKLLHTNKEKFEHAERLIDTRIFRE